ncbi:hypothetical protein H5U98_13365 [Mycolicibacterium boenickei]|uniref:Uncharacterized protein n=1 Tax=Mycolicibacterium boenickei TaxID=146017 RepID=A0AAX3A5Q6_9MYCO|nr:hypothetical protein [Mycolicibacterium boenickei]PEG61551.1 hypothetical protein CQY21_07450 [Mycolicibacterium boenickei]UNC02276.1 hypothetical protein H5U98_13365 [Mycolicibacterium boenickei]BBX92253.1 hypothetical protein MBOE_39020 [Mycolicibacterium boenickei]
MILGTDAGLWSTGPMEGHASVVAVLEVSGAVLSWVVDGEAGEPPSITFTDPERADWLWRVLGEAGHVAVLDALRHREPGQGLDLPAVYVLPGSMDALRRLAIGHWLRRWWPASDRDGIAALERPVLDAELALLTVAAEDFFTDDTLDSDVEGLLSPHLETLNFVAGQGDPRVAELVAQCRELAAEIGIDWPATVVADARREDYALAAGAGDGSGRAGLIAGGVASVDWSAVPPGVFDAAEDTVEWSVTADGAVVRVALAGRDSPAGIGVELRAGGCGGSGVLDAAGRALLPLHDPDGQPLGESRAWNLDWSQTSVRVGAAGVEESASDRARVRAFARARLASLGSDAFLAEVRAAESDY